jgi:hypothetical protein
MAFNKLWLYHHSFFNHFNDIGSGTMCVIILVYLLLVSHTVPHAFNNQYKNLFILERRVVNEKTHTKGRIQAFWNQAWWYIFLCPLARCDRFLSECGHALNRACSTTLVISRNTTTWDYIDQSLHHHGLGNKHRNSKGNAPYNIHDCPPTTSKANEGL